MSASQSSISYFLPDEAATQRFGEISPSPCKGRSRHAFRRFGAGKSSLARAIIRAIADDEELDVPSPTFTLVQSYETLRIPVAHADLYRISHGEELDELGLPEFLEDGVVLAEWPEQAEGFLPEPSLAVTLSHEGAGRRIAVSGPAAAIQRLERSHAIRTFLDLHDRADATRRYLQGDASPRKYETIRTAARGVEILMNAPQMPMIRRCATEKPIGRLRILRKTSLPLSLSMRFSTAMVFACRKCVPPISMPVFSSLRISEPRACGQLRVNLLRNAMRPPDVFWRICMALAGQTMHLWRASRPHHCWL